MANEDNTPYIFPHSFVLYNGRLGAPSLVQEAHVVFGAERSNCTRVEKLGVWISSIFRAVYIVDFLLFGGPLHMEANILIMPSKL